MKRASAPSYDLFKTIVTVILAAILLLMLLRGCAQPPAASAPSAPTEIAAVQSTIEPPASVTVPAATSTVEEATPTLTASPAATAIEATVTSTVTSDTVAPSPTTASATEESTVTAAVEVTPTSAQDASCNTSGPSRLSVGQSARVLRRLNVRSEASIDAPILLTNPTNTQVEIIGGPVCTPVGDSAYLWWQIRLPDGAEGWSAEMPLNEASYFLEPIP